jgi:hypothetical protein
VYHCLTSGGMLGWVGLLPLGLSPWFWLVLGMLGREPTTGSSIV